MLFKKCIYKRVRAKVYKTCKTLHIWIPHDVAGNFHGVNSMQQPSNTTNRAQTNCEEFRYAPWTSIAASPEHFTMFSLPLSEWVQEIMSFCSCPSPLTIWPLKRGQVFTYMVYRKGQNGTEKLLTLSLPLSKNIKREIVHVCTYQ